MNDLFSKKSKELFKEDPNLNPEAGVDRIKILFSSDDIKLQNNFPSDRKINLELILRRHDEINHLKAVTWLKIISKTQTMMNASDIEGKYLLFKISLIQI